MCERCVIGVREVCECGAYLTIITIRVPMYILYIYCVFILMFVLCIPVYYNIAHLCKYPLSHYQ